VLIVLVLHRGTMISISLHSLEEKDNERKLEFLIVYEILYIIIAETYLKPDI